MDLSLSTLADQVGACTTALMPLYLLIEAHVLAAERLHGDDTTVPVLATRAAGGDLPLFSGPAGRTSREPSEQLERLTHMPATMRCSMPTACRRR